MTSAEEFQHNKYVEKGAYHWDMYKKKHHMYMPIVKYILNNVKCFVKVLDLGCGDGLISNLLYIEKKCDVTGIDNDPVAIGLANKMCVHNVKLMGGDITELEDINKFCFDTIIMIDVIEHLDDPKPLLKVIAKAGKQCIIGTPEKRSDGKIHPGHVREYHINEFRELFYGIFNGGLVEKINIGKNNERSYLFFKGRLQ